MTPSACLVDPINFILLFTHVCVSQFFVCFFCSITYKVKKYIKYIIMNIFSCWHDETKQRDKRKKNNKICQKLQEKRQEILILIQ